MAQLGIAEIAKFDGKIAISARHAPCCGEGSGEVFMTRGTWALGLSLALVWVGCGDDEDGDIAPTGGAPGAGGSFDYTGGRPTGGRPTGGSPNETGGTAAGTAGVGTGGEPPDGIGGGSGGVDDTGIGGVNDVGIGGGGAPNLGGGGSERDGSGGAPSAENCEMTAGASACEERGCNPLTARIHHYSGDPGGAGGAGGALNCGGWGSIEFLGCTLGAAGYSQDCFCQRGTDRCVETGSELGWLDGWEQSNKCVECRTF